MNDPNGPIFMDGRLHVFYQHDPVAPRWDRVHWGHAVTEDLVEWQHLPIAISPGDDGPDAFGCWSGSVVREGGVATMFYTAVVVDGPMRRASIRRATSADGLLTWTKDRAAAVIETPPPGVAPDGFRDPFVYRDGDGWAMLVGAGSTDGLGAVLSYRSSDLAHWVFAGPFLSCADLPRAAGADGPVWECPNLLRFGDIDVLVVSVVDRTPGVRPSHVMAVVGRVDGDRFVPDHAEQLGMGPDFYAPATMVAEDGRRMLIGWIPEDPPADASSRDWAGAMTFPRVVSVHADGRIGMALAEEITALRGAGTSSGSRVLSEATGPCRRELASQHSEIRVVIDPGDAAEISLELLDSDPDSPQVRITYQPNDHRLSVARRGIVSVAGRGSQAATVLPVPDDGRLHLRILVDGSVLELEADGRTTATVRLPMMHGPGLGFSVSALGGVATIEAFDTWILGRDGEGGSPVQPVDAATPDQWRIPSSTPSANGNGDR